MRKFVEKRKQSFWDYMNLRVAVINAIIVAVIGIASVYTTNLLTQQALANRVDTLEILTNERQKKRDEQMMRFENNSVTKEVLELTLKPIADEQRKQSATLDQIRAYMIRNPAPFYTPPFIEPTP